jgi:hypothetical protein
MHFSLPLLALFSTALSEGINCNGGAACGLFGTPSLRDLTLDALDFLEEFPDTVFDKFQNGERFNCLESTDILFGKELYRCIWELGTDANPIVGSNLCAFPQGTKEGISTEKIFQLLGFLKEHGCTKCGSVPVSREVWMHETAASWTRRCGS